MRQQYGDDASLVYGGSGSASRSGDFDQVWKVPGKGADGGDLYIVVEAKGGSSPLGTRNVDGGKIAKQGSKEYFDDITRAMSRDGNSPEARQTGRDLNRAMRDDNVQYLEVRTPITYDGLGNSTVSRTQVNEFDISE
jgi:hypothetical protein